MENRYVGVENIELLGGMSMQDYGEFVVVVVVVVYELFKRYITQDSRNFDTPSLCHVLTIS